MRRRTLLRRASVVAALGLAGCAGAPSDEPTPEPTDPPTDSPSPMPTSSASPTPEATDTQTDETTTTGGETSTASPSSTDTDSATETPTATPTPAQEVVVGPGGSLSFDPESFQIAVGDTVLWTWEAGGHNVKVSSAPADSDWSGTPGGEFNTFGSDYTYRHTFDVAGTYEYYCAPHRGSGMTGSFTVG